MPDTNVATGAEGGQTSTTVVDNLASSFEGSETPPTPTAGATTPAATTTTTTQDTQQDDVFDETEYIKSNFGWDSKDSALAEINRLRELEKNPPKPEEIKFQNDESKRLFDAIRAGKVNEVRAILDKQDRLARVSGYDLANADADQAAEIIRTHLSLKNPDLSAAEINRLIAKKYSFPPKPTNNLDLTEDENKAAQDTWQQQVNDIKMDMIIEAKMARPDLEKLKSEIALPDIAPPVDPQIAEAQRKGAEEWQRLRDVYLQTLDRDLPKFDGFKLSYKDEESEYAVAFQPSDKEKSDLKAQLQNFNKDEFFDKRWFDDKGNPRMEVIASDIYLLQNRDKILQKLVNDSAQQRNAEHKKKLHNTQVNGQQSNGTFQPSAVSEQEKQEAAIWEA